MKLQRSKGFTHQNFLKKISGGFTIIETMISVSIFLIVVMIGIDSLLNASLIYQKSRDQRSIMDNLTFIMEDISRNIRTGTDFRCISGVFNVSQVNNTPQSCQNGGGAIVFENASGNPGIITDQWVYKIESTGIDFNIWKSVNGAENFILLNPDEIKLASSSGFYVTGAESSLSGNKQQPLITIRLVGKITTKGKETPFALQTTVSQRVLDQ